MSWAKFDDGYDENPKCRAAGKDGRALDQAGIRYCAKHRTDGLIPDHDLPLLAARADVTARRTVTRLVDVGRWHGPGHDCDRCAERVDCPPGHHVVHDYLDYNPTAKAAEAKSRARAEAGRKGGQKSRPPGKPEANEEAIASPIAKANAQANRNPVPVPPVVTSTDPSRRLSGPDDDEEGQDQQPPDPPSNGADQAERDPLVGTALAVLVERDLAARQQNALLTPIGNVEGWRSGATEKRRQRGTVAALAELANLHPTSTPQQLADLLEPPQPNGNGSHARPDLTAGQREASRLRAEEDMARNAAALATPPADPDTVQAALAAARRHVPSGGPS